MSQKELQRVAVISQCVQGKPGVCQSRGAARSNASTCQTTQSAYRQGSAAALAHASRGRPSHRRLPQRVRDRILQLARTTYAGFNDHHLCEKLTEQEGFSLGRETLRRLLRSARASARPANVALPLIASAVCASLAKANSCNSTASPHDWLEGRGPQPHRSGHSRRRYRQNPRRPVLYRRKPPEGYFHLLQSLLRRYGVPARLLRRSHGIFVRNDDHWTVEEELAGQRQPTQFGRALATTRHHLHRRHSLPRPRAASNVSGACCKIASPANCAWPRPAIWIRPTGSCTSFIADYNRRFARAPRETEQSLAPRSRGSRPHLLLRPRTHRQQRQRRAMGRPSLPDPAPAQALQLRRSKSPALAELSKDGSRIYYGDTSLEHT